MTLTIPGIGVATISVTAEYVSGNVLQVYLQNLGILKQVYDTRADASGGQLSYSDYENVLAAVKKLTSLLKNGIPDGTATLTTQGYLTGDLATKLGVVLQTLKAIGITDSSEPSTTATGQQADLDKLTSWQSLAGVGVEQTLISAVTLSDTSPTRSLQSMIELEYVKQANDIIAGQLQNLEQALQTSQTILDSLSVIQGLSNQIKAPQPAVFPNPAGYTNDPDGYTAAYRAAANAYFAQMPALVSPTSTAGFQLLAAQSSLAAQLTTLEKTTGHFRTSANTLAFFVAKVIKDISASFSGYYAIRGTQDEQTNKEDANFFVKAWILDGNQYKLGVPGAANAGNIQDNIAQSIKAAQSLNDTQKQNVNNYMFIFEEFYKSSSAVLQQVNDILVKMAQNIGGA